MGWEGKAEMMESREECGESISESRFEIGLEMGGRKSVRFGDPSVDVDEDRAISTGSLRGGVGFCGARVKSMNWSKWEKSPDEVLPVDTRPLTPRRRVPVPFDEEADESDEGEYDNSGSSLDASLPPGVLSHVFLSEILRRPFDVIIIPPSESESLQ